MRSCLADQRRLLSASVDRYTNFGIARLLGYLFGCAVFDAWMTLGPSSGLGSRVVACIMAAIPIGTVVTGFLYHLPQVASVLLPRVREGQPGFSLDGIPAQSFLQGITYRVRMRNLWLLAISPLLSLAVWAMALRHRIMATTENQLPVFGAMGAAVVAMYIAVRWWHERKLLDLNCSGIVQVLDVGKTEISYQFFDHRQDRRGGTVRFRKPVAPGDLAPIFVDPYQPDESRLFASFWFFRFDIVDSRHLAPELLIHRAKG